MMASTAGVMVLLGGVTAQSFGAFICIALVAGLTIGGRQGIALALLGAAISGAFVLAEAQEVLPEQVLFVSPLDYWAGMALNLFAAAMLVHIALRRLNGALSVAEASRLESRASLERLRATQAANDARAAQGAALGQLGQELVRFSDLESLCDRVVGTIMELMEVDQAVGFRLAPNGTTLTTISSQGDLDVDWPEDLVAEGSSELKQVLDGGSHAFIVRRSPGGRIGAAGVEGLGAAVLAAIPGRDRPHGLLCAATRRDREFSEAEQDFIVTLAGLLASAIDRQQAEEQLRQSQKMDAIGQLAGGVAHDFNNLLTSILSCSELMLAELPRSSSLRELAQDVKSAGEMAAILTRQLLAFSRKQVVCTEHLDLNEVVLDLGSVLRRLIGEHIKIENELSDASLGVFADRGNLEQVVLNLVLNARDSIAGSGRILIQTRLLPADERKGDLAIGPGDVIVLSVEDSGCGMDDDVRSRVFEPFFTTKGEGKGTGLGLSTVLGVVRQSGGEIRVTSSLGRGARFDVYLPRHTADMMQGEETPGTALPHGQGLVLLVEDDVLVRRSIRRVLTRSGFEVIEAQDGREALTKIEAGLDPDLVLTDMVMPNMTGDELAGVIEERELRIPVVLMTGYAPDMLSEHSLRSSRTQIIHKPFSTPDLVNVITTMIAGTRNF
jgi:signal transduction histidine kinase/ActR/RegA family two-component response regulator